MNDQADSNKRKILVIDDDPLVLKSVGGVLRRADYAYVLVDDGFKAEAELKKQSFDLVISDIRMPGRNGIETVEEIRNLVNQTTKKDLPIIFITGYATMGQELNAEELGEVILKPFDLDHLLNTIREYL
jgi:CheY-like chemotaxis protein